MRRLGYITIPLFLILLTSCHREARPLPTTTGPLHLSVVLSTNVIHVGDLVSVQLNATHPAGAKLQLPELARGKAVIVRDQRAGEKAAGKDLAQTTVRWVITSFEVGTHTLSTGTVAYAKADGGLVTQPFPAAQFQVNTMLAGPDTPRRDIKGLASWPGAFPRWITGLLVVAGLALVAAFVVGRFLSRPRTILEYPPPPPPYEVALKALRDLLTRGWIETENVEPFYVELSRIVRQYIEDRFRLRAPERTTEEFIREAANSRLLSSEHQQLTRDFLEQSDRVKFARHRPAQTDMKNGYAAAERLVRETTPPPSPPPTAS